MRPLSFSHLSPVLFVCIVLLAACDSTGAEEVPESPTGTWLSIYDVRFDSVGTIVDAGNGSTQTVRAQYNGRQIVTLMLSEERGAVTGSIHVEEEGFMRTKRYVGGELVADFTDDYMFSGEAALEGTYSASALQVTSLSEGDDLVRALFGELKVEFEDEWVGRGFYHRGITPNHASPTFRVHLQFSRLPSGG